MYVCVHVYVGQILWNWSYRWLWAAMWVLGITPGFSERVLSALTGVISGALCICFKTWSPSVTLTELELTMNETQTGPSLLVIVLFQPVLGLQGGATTIFCYLEQKRQMFSPVEVQFQQRQGK